MATVVVAVFLPFLCFDVVFSAAALSAAPSGLNSEFYNDVRQLLELNSVLYQKNENEKRNYGGESTLKPDVPRAVKQWPEIDLNLGQVSGVSVNTNQQPVIFHRADRVWDE
ncbi:hypothetical protein ILUMI_25493 [Ignelater luminosus]|uniref:Uncharacterized protein n=1 Tax=Ignelater luminosus TaxID=2038154 RepID=A0A8K0C5H1_IGNLU|nr:hypothetical protein ILUMI_25493 [Ignelater luminosus]